MSIDIAHWLLTSPLVAPLIPIGGSLIREGIKIHGTRIREDIKTKKMIKEEKGIQPHHPSCRGSSPDIKVFRLGHILIISYREV